MAELRAKGCEMDSAVRDRVRNAISAFNQGRHDEARRLCEEGLRRQPRDAILNQLLAAVLFAKGDMATARTHAEVSLAVRADSAPAQLLAGRIARAAQDFDAALIHLGRAAVLAPNSEARLELARTLDAAGRRVAA